MWLRVISLVSLLTLLSAAVAAEEILLKNGQTLTGRVIRQTHSMIRFKTSDGKIRVIEKKKIRRIIFVPREKEESQEKAATPGKKQPKKVAEEKDTKRSIEGATSKPGKIEKPISEKEKSSEAPAVEEPAVEKPAVEKPAVEKPAVEKPAVEEPAVEEPAVEEPADEEPAVEEPAVEEPAVEEPSVEEPAVEEPAVEEPAVEEPAVEEPSVEEPAVEEPADEEPADEEPSDEEPSDEEPSDEESSDEETLEGKPFERFPMMWRSLLFPGWGQIYAGDTKKGLIYAGLGGLFVAGYLNQERILRGLQKDYRGKSNQNSFLFINALSLLGQNNIPIRDRYYYAYLSMDKSRSGYKRAEQIKNGILNVLAVYWMHTFMDTALTKESTESGFYLKPELELMAYSRKTSSGTEQRAGVGFVYKY